MENSTSKTHWETVYSTKTSEQVSWYQTYPHTSMAFVREANLPPGARIIDIGGGDSNLVDALLDAGFTNITVLDISAKAIERAKNRLGERAALVRWVVSDVAEFQPESVFDFWHDRAAFHFLVEKEQVGRYAELAQRSVRPGGHFVLGTFSEKGPQKCSGLEIKQYSRAAMRAVFDPFFRKVRCTDEEHRTPFDTTQQFLFCRFKRRSRV